MSNVAASTMVNRAQLIPETVLPWEIDLTLAKWGWSTTFISSRAYYDRHVWQHPEQIKIVDQVMNLVPYFYGTRNFILCFSTDPVYVRKLYHYLAAAWALTTNSRVEIADIQELIEVMFGDDEARKEAIWQADLLFLPYAAKDHPGISKVRGAISNMLLRRKAAGLPTVTDLYIKRKPRDKMDLVNYAKRLVDTFGDVAFDLFWGDAAKYVYINTPKVSEMMGKKGEK